MGWTWLAVEKGKSKEFMDKNMTSETEATKWEVVRSAFVGFREYYAAVRITKKDENKSYVLGVVCLVQYAPKEIYNFGYKDMEESCGPNVARCPKTILELLSPLEEIYGKDTPDNNAFQWAKGWRERCWNNVNKVKPKMNDGDTIKFEKPISFTSGEKIDTFVVVKQGRKVRFRKPNYPMYSGYYRLTRNLLQNAVVIPKLVSVGV